MGGFSVSVQFTGKMCSLNLQVLYTGSMWLTEVVHFELHCMPNRNFPEGLEQQKRNAQGRLSITSYNLSHTLAYTPPPTGL